MSQSTLRAANGASLDAQRTAPIGVFDSGLGGLSVWRHLRAVMPHEDFIYMADTANVPYGDKTEAWICERLNHIVNWFLAQGCKTVVLACNTATAAAGTYLRERFPELFIVGLEPAIKPALQLTQNGTIAMLATARTVGSAKYARLLDACAQTKPDVKVLSIACVGLAEKIDAGQAESAATQALLATYTQMAQGADVVVLGCTHYPFVAQQIRGLMGKGVQIIDSGAPVARYTKDVLQARSGLNQQAKLGRNAWFASAIAHGDAQRWALFCGENVEILAFN